MTPAQGATAECLSTAEVVRLAEGEHPTHLAAHHLDTCESCRQRLSDAREEAAFVSKMRGLVDTTPAGEVAPIIPGYRTLGILSAGAQGIVYRGVQEHTSRPVAIKTLATTQVILPRQRLRVEREAEIAARLRHPNIVTVYESRTLWDGRIAFVMEFVDGVPLDQWAPPGATPAERLRAHLRVFAAACWAVHHAHINGVIHRDLKPDNILVTPEGRPVVLDFGIAKVDGPAATLTGEFAGTPAYASPEQVSGKRDTVDALTDVYSMGVLLYKLLCGKLPHDLEGSILQMARVITEVEPVRPRIVNPGVPTDLEAIIQHAMEKDKARRYQSAAALASDIERFLKGDPVSARSGSGWYMLRKAARLNRGRLIAASLALIIAAVAALFIVKTMAEAFRARELASQRQQQLHAESVRARAVTELLREALPSSSSSSSEVANAMGTGLLRLYSRLETGEFADDPDVDQAIRRLWAEVYTVMGSGKNLQAAEYSEVALRSGLTRLRQTHPGDHLDIAATLHNLAGVVFFRNRNEESLRLCREALAMRSRILGDTSTPAAESRALLARILLATGQPDEAATEAAAAQRVLIPLPAPESDLQIAWMQWVQSRVLIAAGNLAAAEPFVHDALARRFRRLACDDPDLLASLRDAALITERLPDAPLSRHVAAVWLSADALSATLLARDIDTLAAPDKGTVTTPVKSGRTAAVGRMLNLQSAVLGPDDASLVRTLMAQVKAANGEFEVDFKVSALLRASDLLAKRFGEDHPAVIMCLEEASLTLANSGHADRAVDLCDRLDVLYAKLPPGVRDPIVIANSHRMFAWFRLLAGRYADAAPMFRTAAEEFRRIGGDRHHVVALSEAGLAICLVETGQLAEADAISECALCVADSLTSIHPDQIAHIRLARGHALVALGRFAEARQPLQLAWDLQYRNDFIPIATKRMLIADLATIAERLGEPAAAEAWRRELASKAKADQAATNP